MKNYVDVMKSGRYHDIEDLVNLQLANYQVTLPNSREYNSQFEQAKSDLFRAKQDYELVRIEYEKKMKQMDEQERQIQQKQKELCWNQAEAKRFADKQVQKAAEIDRINQVQQAEYEKQLQELADLVDEVSASSALLTVLQEREKEYSKYSEQIIQLNNKISSQQLELQIDAFASIQTIQKAQQFVKNIYQKLDMESQQAFDLENSLQQQLNEIQQQESQQKAHQNALDTTQINKMREITMQIGKEVEEKEKLEQEIQAISVKLSSKTIEIAETNTAIDNLCTKVEFQSRQLQIVEKAPIQQLIGGQNQDLEEAVNQYYEVTGKIIPREECYRRVLGDTTVEKLKQIYKLNLWIQDAQELLELCEREKAK